MLLFINRKAAPGRSRLDIKFRVELSYNASYVGGEKLNRNGKQDYSEELAEDIDKAGTKYLLDTVD